MQAALFILFSFVAIAAAGLTPEQKEKLASHRKICLEETKLDPSVVDKIKKGEMVTFDEKLNCYSACMLKKIGIMNADGSINEEVARMKAPKEEFPKEKLDQIIDQCKTLVGANDCEKGGKVLACMIKNKVFAFDY